MNESEVTQIILDLARENATHIAVLNDELGGVEAQLAVQTEQIKFLLWFVYLQIGGMLGLFIQQFRIHKTVRNGK